MSRAGSGGFVRSAGRRRPLAAMVAVAAALALTGCPSAARPPEAVFASGRDERPPVPAADAPDDGSAATGPARTVDLTRRGRATEVALDVIAAPDGGALVLMGEPREGTGTRLVAVSAEGTTTGSLPVPGLTAAAALHLLPGDRALVSGRLTGENALGYAVADLDTGAVRTAAAVPLDPATVRVLADSAVSSDGRTVWLYTGALADGRYLTLLSGHDLATDALVASRDLFAELRAVHSPVQELDPVELVATTDGGVRLAVNAYPPRAGPLWEPMLLGYDAALEPIGPPVPLGPAGAGLSARAVSAVGGTLFVLLRGWPVGRLVAVRPGDRTPELLLEVPGFGFTDTLVVDTAHGWALLPAADGVRRVELASGDTTWFDVGCPAAATVVQLAGRADAGAWVLGGCGEDGAADVLWRIP